MKFFVAALVLLVGCRDRTETKTEPAVAPAGSAPAPIPLPVTAQPVTGPISPPVDLATPPATAARTMSGVASIVLERGTTTQKPAPGDRIRVHYTAWAADGTVFDSSVQRGVPETILLAAAPRAWAEVVADMTVGEKRRLWIPEAVASSGRAGQPRGMLVYEVQLMAIVETPAAPADLANAPADATKTSSGLAYKRLVTGEGTVHPTEANMLVVDYSGWAADGTIVESTVTSGRHTERPLSGMLPGIAEALRLMVEGDTMRLWLADKPKGMVVVDVTLLAIK